MGLAELYRIKCDRCHTAYDPQEYSARKWETIIAEMAPLSGLDGETEEKILAYLRGAAGEESEGRLPTDPVLSGYLYTEYFASKAAIMRSRPAFEPVALSSLNSKPTPSFLSPCSSCAVTTSWSEVSFVNPISARMT